MAILLAVVAGLCWGVGEVFTRSVLHSHQVGPLTAIAVRSSVALPLLWLAWAAGSGAFAAAPLGLRAEPPLVAAERATLLKLVLGSGVIAGAIAMIAFYGALSLGEISRVKPIAFALAPATAVILGWLVLGESMSARKAVAVGFILLGVVLLTAGGGRQSAEGAATPHAAGSAGPDGGGAALAPDRTAAATGRTRATDRTPAV